MSTPDCWSIIARNLSEHAGNPIHTDEGARAAGFDRALVAGVTTYAYCCHPIIDWFGPEWVASGEAEVRFRAPVCDGERLGFRRSERPDGGIDLAVVVERSDRPVVEAAAWRSHRTDGREAARSGERLKDQTVCLEGDYGAGYAARAGDVDSGVPAGVVHPAVWPAIANRVFHDQLVRGSWIHTRSIIRHHSAVPEGSEAELCSTVIERFRRGGERAVGDVVVRVGGVIVATVEHEAIVDLSPEAV